MKKILKFLVSCCLVLILQTVYAEPLFIVRQIRVIGLQRVQESTVISYMPIHLGQPITTQDTVNILTDLYRTGFFSNITLQRQGSILIVNVIERPTIGLIKFTGNKQFTDKQLLPVLKDMGIVEGAPYDSSKVNSIIQGLKEQYNQLGYYAVQVTAQAQPEPRNRIALLINVKEGPIARIHLIAIRGNTVFSQKQILKVFTSRRTAWWRLSFLSHNDRYSKVQLAKDLEELRNFYFNHGYIRFQIIDQKLVVTPDNKMVDIFITISEGPQYRVKGFEVKGLVGYPEESAKVNEYLNLMLKPGSVFSKKNMLDASEGMRMYFASRGHAFPIISSSPEIDDATHQVYLIFTINPGPVSYVRQINFSGNTRTQDRALRNNVSQMEGSPYSLVDVEQSKARLAYLPYLQDVGVDTNPVPGKDDQVDLEYHVKEVNAGKASIQGGYSTSDGFIYGASLSEPNLFGTGNYGALAFNASQFQKTYSLTYSEPYFTTNGISQTVTLFSNITTPSTDLNQASYTMDGYGGTLTYGIPVSLHNRINLGFGYTYVDLHDIDAAFTSPTIKNFVQEHPDPYNQFKGILSWNFSTLDRALAPTRGLNQFIGLDVGIPILSDSLSYYKLDEDIKYFYPLWYGFIIEPNASVGYGNGYGNVDQLPFFLNYYAGGIETIPGYEPNSLGPKNPNQYNAALGGNFRAIAGTNLILPSLTEKVRTALTFDAGNVWDTSRENEPGQPQVQYESVAARNIRMSSGLLVIWYSPMGPLEFSFAKTINAKSTDQKQFFSFSFGASL